MHVGFAIAWFDQHESSEDRYLFFRSAYKHFMGFYSWPDDDLDDRDVANILGINPGTLRTRTSRLCAKVKRLVGELNDALIASLNRQSLDIAKEIYAEAEPDMEAILEELLGKASVTLSSMIDVRTRREKTEFSQDVREMKSQHAENDMPCPCFDMDERNCSRNGQPHSRMFKEL